MKTNQLRQNMKTVRNLLDLFEKKKKIESEQKLSRSSISLSFFLVFCFYRAFIFGLNEQQAKSSITHCGRQVFINSGTVINDLLINSTYSI